MFSFCQHIDDSQLKDYAPRIVLDLGPFLSNTSDDALVLVLETLAVVVKIDLGSWLTPELIGSLTSATLEAWRKNSKGV